MEIRPYESAHLDDAAGVLAKAHERRSAELPGAFRAADETRVVIGAFTDRRFESYLRSQNPLGQTRLLRLSVFQQHSRLTSATVCRDPLVRP